jgi:DNA polymerase I-like protein with 3'-5' exonuclease and polymerase domains
VIPVQASLLDAYRLLQEGAEALAVVERQGIVIDVAYCREKIQWLDEKMSQAERRLSRTDLAKAWIARYGSKVNYDSGPQLQSVLYADLYIAPFKQTQTGEGGSIDEESLRQVALPGIDNLLQKRRYKKMRDFLAGFIRYQVDGILHPSFLLHTVSTFRSSSSSPNMQNVPKRDKEAMEICRRAIVPRKGYGILEVDFSGLEVNISQTYAKDPEMMRYLNDPKSDMHADTAFDLFKLQKYGSVAKLKSVKNFSSVLRQSAKNGFVFPEFYGDFYEPCAFNVAFQWCKLPRTGSWNEDDGVEFGEKPIGAHMREVGFTSLEDFTQHVKTVEDSFWNRRFRTYGQWRKDWFAEYQRTGTFNMHTGFRVSGLLGKNMVVNYPIQGAAFHVLLSTLIKLVYRLRGFRSKVIGEIHDSVLVDYHPDEFHEVVELCHRIATVEVASEWKWINVPLRVETQTSEIDGNWAEMRVVE